MNSNKNKEGEYAISDNKVEFIYLDNKLMNSPRITLTNKSFEDSVIKEEEIDVNINITENLNLKEKQLSVLFDSLEVSYLEKSYEDLIKNIEEKEYLLYQNSLMSFKIKILKIKGCLKLLMIEYNNFLQAKNKTFHEIDEIIHKIKNEFQITSILLNNTDSYVYEIVTQIYCKFLYLLSKICSKREDYLKSLGYVILGINMLKIYFIRKKIALDIKTYKIYCKLILEIINILIGDKNYGYSLYYIRLLFKIIETSIKIIYFNNSDKNMKFIPIVTIKKFLNLGGIGNLYAGCCLEKLDNPSLACEAYKQAKLFFKKGAKLGFSFQNFNIININNSCPGLVEELFEKMKIKFEKDKIERLNRQKMIELQKRKEKIELLHKVKLMKLKYIASGFGGNPFKYQHLENNFHKKIFPSSIKNNLESIDDDLSSLVFTYFDKNRIKDTTISSYNRKMSTNTKKMMSRYEACNILMSNKFRKFIIRTKRLEFYNPKSASNSISIIQRYLNNKMKINSKQKNNTQRKSLKLSNNDITIFKAGNKSNINGNKFNRSQNPNIIKNKKFYTTKTKVRNDLNFSYNRHNTNKKNNSQIIMPHSSSFNLIKRKNNIKFKYKLLKANYELENDFERKKLDKNLMTNSYSNKYSYYEKLSDNELRFQKDLLYYKYNNSLYKVRNSVEEKDGIIGKDSLSNFSLIIDERAKERAKLLVNNNLLDINLLKDCFTTKQNKFSLKMKSAMSSVINKYISQKKSKSGKENLVNIERIQKNNEKKISHLDNSINNINYNISQIENVVKKYKKKLYF